MSKYLIHSCPKRQWYVEGYLIPSMLEQGIRAEDIMVYQDKERKGNLKGYLDSCQKLLDVVGEEGGTWHMQDDVLICSDFRKRTEILDAQKGVVCGFTSCYDGSPRQGTQPIQNMWWSFPCMRIPNSYLRDFLQWVEVWVWRDNQYAACTKANKGDDYIFKVWAINYRKNDPMYGCVPTLVEHVDYLIGGSEVNKQRDENKSFSARSKEWQEEHLVKRLEERLRADGRLKRVK